MLDSSSLPAPGVLAHVVDAHCHPTDAALDAALMSALPHRICAMATRASDQALVRDLAARYPDAVLPCFGYHPWFAHWISLEPEPPSKEAHYALLFLPPSSAPHTPAQSAAFARLLPFLPPPTPIATVLASLRADLAAHPSAMLGEVGIDRACRVPYAPPAEPPYASADDEKRELSPFTIPLEHQVAIFEAQLALAVELRRNVSVHSVKAQQATVELFARMKERYGDKWLDISVDMHSCGLSAQTWLQLRNQHPNLFLSLSTAINTRSVAHKSLIQGCSPYRILSESDFHDVRFSAPYTWDMVVRIAEEKGWWIESTEEEVLSGRKAGEESEGEWGVVRRLEENWKSFVRGGNRVVPGAKKKRDKKGLLLEESEEEDGPRDENETKADVPARR
ncbi:TatD DNase family Scn1 [Laetiporus sulphureus 93-53]|uniref:TatD DNase family Scn1 n=1 Tax=Laetiporus sulphureus 93-53 TaxID=1314785 RepID=A0A165FA20_9APHY|nr:TatD DNase family Scn1 [Laetiporus sulphureus 93-53]KZT08659.1 TatD DNase family Scn1 [Laetiporus sulphureus 93-53]